MKSSDGWQLWLIVALLVALVGLMGYQIVDGISQGVVVAYSRVGPSSTYSLAGQPKEYWFTLVGMTVVEILLILFSVGTTWLARKVSSISAD